MKRIIISGNILALVLILCDTFRLCAQERRYDINPKALNAGVYDPGKVKKNPYKVYYGGKADEKFDKLLRSDARLRNFSPFGEYIKRDDGSTVYFREQEAYEYCPELGYVMITGVHGYVSAYDLKTLEEIFVNPSSYVYSPSGKYRFGTFDYDGMKYYIEVREGDKYTPYLLCYTYRGFMSGVYWVDDQTIHYLSEQERSDGTKYQDGYSVTLNLPTQDHWRSQPVYNTSGVLVGRLGDEVAEGFSVDDHALYTVDTLLVFSQKIPVRTDVFVSGINDGYFFSSTRSVEAEPLDKNTCRLIFQNTIGAGVDWLTIKRKGGKLYVIEELTYDPGATCNLVLGEDDMTSVDASNIMLKKKRSPIEEKIIHRDYFDFHSNPDGVESYYFPRQYTVGQGLKFMQNKREFSNAEFLNDN